MPARIPLQPCLRLQRSVQQKFVRTFSTTLSPQASTGAQKRYKHDPYARAQALAKQAANKSRQEVLKKERAEALGDPVRGVTTSFIQSFDTGKPSTTDAGSASIQVHEKADHLNFLLAESQANRAIEWAHHMYATSQPTGQPLSPSPQQKNAEEAIRRILALNLGNGKDRQRVNTQRAIEVFGRHNTDASAARRRELNARLALVDRETEAASEELALLKTQMKDPQVPPEDLERIQEAAVSAEEELHRCHSKTAGLQYTIDHAKDPIRAGPDTGSSEVQIAILTAKIRTLADFLETRGKNDKANKRNLRLLVHRRQKLMRYMQRKERGGPRWQHLVEKLGLTDGMWKGEISL